MPPNAASVSSCQFFDFMRAGALAASTLLTAELYRQFAVPDEPVKQNGEQLANVQAAETTVVPVIKEARTSFADITHYNNFYEFSTDKAGVAYKARNFVTRPWTVEVGGLVQKPKTFDLDDLLKLAPAEERVYRHRCVEGWSMVIPWVV